jgi:hypothetical protein
VLKGLNANTQVYLQALGASDRSSASRGIGQQSRDDLLDGLFDPLEADQAMDASELENAWLLGTPSYLPGVTGADTMGTSAYDYWSENDELSI